MNLLSRELKHSFKLHFLLVMILSCFNLTSQINNPDYRINLNSLDMGPCGGSNDALSRIGVFAKNNLVHDFEISFDLPDGVFYVPGSERITFQQGSSDFTLSVVDMSNLNEPVFRLERPGDANWAVADLVRFRFDKTATCEAVEFSYAGGLFKDGHTINYQRGTAPLIASDTDPTINSYELLRAFLAVLNYADVNATIGQNVSRTLNITNSGNGNVATFEHNVNVGSDLSGYELIFNGNVLTPSAVSGANRTYIFDLSQAPFAGNVGDGDALFENETIGLTENFTVINCGDTNISHQPTWGCDPATVCQALAPVIGQVLVDTSIPSISIQRIGFDHPEIAAPITHQLRVQNTSNNEAAYNVFINNGFGDPNRLTTPTSNPREGNNSPGAFGKEFSNFRIEGTSITPVILPSSFSGTGSYTIPPDFFTTDPDGTGTGFEDLDGDGFFDDLAPNAFTDLYFDIDYFPETRPCNDLPSTYISGWVLTDVYVQNQCGLTSGTTQFRSDNSRLLRQAPSTNSPTDVVDNTGFIINVTPEMQSDRGGIQCNGLELFTDDPSTTMTVTLMVPEGISLNSATPGFTQVSPTEIEYTTDRLFSGNTTNLSLPVDFPLILDCASYTGPQDLDLSYTATYSSNCFTEDIHCGTITGIRAQCNGNCNGVSINSFNAERTSLGWTDMDMTTPITPDPNIHNLETYMSTDEMRLRTTGTFNNTNADNLFFDLFYTSERAQAGLADVLNFLTGTLTINDISSGAQNISLDPNDISVTSTGLDHRLRIDLTNYRSIISPTYTYGEPQIPGGSPEPDQVSLELFFRIGDNIPLRSTIFELENFSGRFFYNDPANNPIICNTLGDRAYYIRPIIAAQPNYNVSARDCNEATFNFNFNVVASNFDVFPNEYRRGSSWSSVSFDIPANTEFTGVVETAGFPGGNNNLNVAQTGNTLTITPDANFRYPDIDGNQSPRLQIRVRSTNTTAPTTITNFNYIATAYPDSSTPISLDRSGTIQFLYEQPEFTISSVEPVVIADNVGATFEVDVCLDSTTDIDYNWLRIANGSNFTVTNAYEVTGAGNVPLNFNVGPGETYLEIGQLVASVPTCKKIRFETSYTSCSAFDFTVDSSWSCTGYPADFSTEAYSNAYAMRLEPQDAVLQFAILDEPSGSVDMCSDFNIDLEVRNAGNGNLINPTVSLDIPGDASSLTFNDVLVEYPRGSAPQSITSYTVVGNTLTIDLAGDPDIAFNNGLMGAINANNINEQIAIVRLDMSVACSFISSTAITFETNAENPCGSMAIGDGSRLSTNPLIVTGAEPFYDAVSTINIPNGGTFSGCNTETVSVESTIVGGPTGSTDFARIVLPDGLTFNQTSFSSTGTFAATLNSITTVGSHEEILLNMPSGANNGDIITYSFDVTPRNTETTCAPNARIELFNFVTFNSLSCGASFCSAYDVPVGDTYSDIAILKPELIESIFTSNANYTTDGSGNYEYHIAFGVENTGTVDINSGFMYDVYCADASGVRSGTSIYTGTINQVITAGNSITEDIIFTTATFCGDASNMIVEFVPSDTNCHCDVLSIPLASEPEVADLELTSSVDIVSANPGDTVTFSVQVLNNGPFDAQNIGVENLLPIGYTIASIGNSGSQSGNIIAWPQFDLASGDTITFTFTATLNSPTGIAGEYDNITEVVAVDEYDSDSTPDNYDGLPLEDDEAIVAVTILTANLSLNKAPSVASGPDYNVGDTVTFELTLINSGPDEANDVSIEDIVPSGFTVGSINNGGVLVGNTITWDIANVPVGSRVLSYDVVINAPTNIAGEYTNIAQVMASDQFDPNSSPNNDDGDQSEDDEDSATITLSTADLSLNKSLSATSNPIPNVGDTITFELTLNNNGPDGADNVSIEDVVPSGFTVGSINNGGVLAGNTITWDIANLPVGDQVLSYEATMNAPANTVGEYTNIAQVTASDQFDPNSTPNNDDGDQSEDDEDSFTIALPSADLSLTKDLSATSVPNVGDTITFELTLNNNGPGEATNVSIADVVPSGYTIGIINNGGVLVGSTITWDIANVPVGSLVLSYEVNMNAPTNTVGEYTNLAQVTASDQQDPNSTPNNDDGDQSEDDEASYTIDEPTTDLEITKTVDRQESVVGQTVIFTVGVTNIGLNRATNIGIEDILPLGFDLISNTADIGSYDENTGVWEIGSLEPGVSALLEMSATVTEIEEYTNTAQLIYLDQIDSNTDNDRAEATVEVTQECLIVFNEFSPNNDGANEFFFIECIENYPNNTVQVFNRWGTKVFEQQGYDNTWDGTSMGRATNNANEKLPVGTYYYTLQLGDGQTPVQSGWLYISR